MKYQLIAAKEQLHNKLVFENNGEVVTDSLMITEMFKKDHDKVLRDIRIQMDYAGEEFSLANFGESNYTNERGRTYPKYNLTEEAFTLVAMSYNTKEAVQMKIKFIQEFKRMKKYIQKQRIPNDPMSILKVTFDALQGHEQEIQGIKTEVKDIQENTPLFAIECDEISNAVKRCGVALLRGKNSNAYQDKSLRGKVYQDIHRQLRRHFDVKSHKAIKRRHLEVAKSIVADYELPIVLSEEIDFVNSQMNINEVQ